MILEIIDNMNKINIDVLFLSNVYYNEYKTYLNL